MNDYSVQSVLVICINYHSEKDTLAFVRDVFRQEYSGMLHVMVVDNNEKAPSETLLSNLSEFDQCVQVGYPGKNLGYFGGAAWGLSQYLIDKTLPDWIIVSNTDIEFTDRDFFSRLTILHKKNNCALIAPAIYSTQAGVDQNPFMEKRPSVLRMKLYKWVFHFYSIYVLYQTAGLLKQKISRFIKKTQAHFENSEMIASAYSRQIYAPHGSFIIFHRNYFEAGGSLNHGVFLFGEEVFVAESARRLGLTVMYDPSMVLWHREHATTSILADRKKAKYVSIASAYCADEFFS